eukprot:gene11303-biopygen6891
MASRPCGLGGGGTAIQPYPESPPHVDPRGPYHHPPSPTTHYHLPPPTTITLAITTIITVTITIMKWWMGGHRLEGFHECAYLQVPNLRSELSLNSYFQCKYLGWASCARILCKHLVQAAVEDSCANILCDHPVQAPCADTLWELEWVGLGSSPAEN